MYFTPKLCSLILPTNIEIMNINVKIYLTALLFNDYILLFRLLIYLRFSFFYVVQSAYTHIKASESPHVHVFLYTRKTTGVLILVEIFAALAGAKKIHNPFLSKLFNQAGAFFSG